jgi:putative membrane protein
MTERMICLIVLLIVTGVFLIYLPRILIFRYAYIGWPIGRGLISFGLGLAFLIGLAAIVLMAVGAYLLFSGSKTQIIRGKAKAIEILNERYAKGEITREDYIRMKEDLQR